MSRAGRKRSTGKRHPSGRLVQRTKDDRGTPEIQARRRRYAGETGDPQQTVDAIGRAYCAGLVTADQRDAARRFAALYWQKLPAPNPISSLYKNMVQGLVEEMPAGTDRQAIVEDADARDIRQERALNIILKRLNAMGHHIRRAFDELVIDHNPDSGPPWLDRLLVQRHHALVWNAKHREAGFAADDAQWWLAPVRTHGPDLVAWQRAVIGFEVIMGSPQPNPVERIEVEIIVPVVSKPKRERRVSSVHPAFLDEAGLMRPMGEVAAIIRDRHAESSDNSQEQSA